VSSSTHDSSKPQQTLPSLFARADLLEVHGEMTTNSSSSGEKDAYPCDQGGGGAITVECTWAKICNGDSEGSCTGKSEGLSDYDNLYASIRACNLRYVGYVGLLSCTVRPTFIHHTPYTTHHTPYTMHHTPYTKRSYSIHHTPYTPYTPYDDTPYTPYTSY
jgi:hypothetical protein